MPKGCPREGGAAREARRGGGGWYEEAGPACKCRARKESPILMVPRETINHLQFFEGLELIIRLSIYSDLFFTHLSKSIARSESLTWCAQAAKPLRGRSPGPRPKRSEA